MKLGKNHIIIGLVSAIVLYFIINALYNHFLSEEQKIKNLFYEMASEIEERDVLTFNKYFTKKAEVHYLGFDIPANNIVPFLITQLKQRGEFTISFRELNIEIQEDKAVVTFIAIATEDLEGGRMLRKRVTGASEGTVKLEKIDGDWKIYDATGREHSTPRMQF